MEIYKQIRKMRPDGMSQRQIAATLHISRNTVKKYWDGDSVPVWKGRCCGMNVADELIRLYAKQLKIPSFAEYREVLRQADPSAGFADLLLELMKAETASRQENQNRRRLKVAGFPYLKTMEEFDCNQLNDAVSRCSRRSWPTASLSRTGRMSL